MKKIALPSRLALRDLARPALLTALPFVFALSLAGCASTVDLGPPGSPNTMNVGSGPVDTVVPASPEAAPAPTAAGTKTASSAPVAGPDGLIDADPASDKPASAVLPPYDPLQPDAQVDLRDQNARADLWARVRAGFTLPDLDSPDVKTWEQWYSSRPDYVARMTARGSRYLYHITLELERRHMPSELALLPFTESAFNPQAMSVAKASGMWQFVSSTGKDYDLKQNIFRDDRRDVLASTRAALDYLQRLHDMFGDWQLALAAYNCGEGTVQRAINRNTRAGLPTDYLSLNLPAETRGYVPKLQAVKNIVMHPDLYGLTLPALGNHPYFLSVPIERDIDVDTAAKLANVSIDEFKMLNPQLNKPVILAAGTPQVLLPYDNADDFVRGVESHDGPLATWTAWVATRTLRPADAAKQVGMTEAELREVNHIPVRMLVKAGSTLLVPRSAQHTSDVSEKVADSAAMSLAPDLPPTRRVIMRVGKGGESVAAVARRWHVSTNEVATWNHVSPRGKFGAGATAVLFLPRSAAVARAASAPEPVAATPAPPSIAASAATQAKATAVAAVPGKGRAATKVAAGKGRGAQVASAKGTRKATVVAQRKGGGTPSKRTEKTKVRVAQH